MARVGEVTGVHDRVIAEAVAWYARIPLQFNGVDRRVMRRALRIARGDWHRLVIESPKAVTVHNRPMW